MAFFCRPAAPAAAAVAPAAAPAAIPSRLVIPSRPFRHPEPPLSSSRACRGISMEMLSLFILEILRLRGGCAAAPLRMTGSECSSCYPSSAPSGHLPSSEQSAAFSHRPKGAMLACALRSSSSQKSRAAPCDFREPCFWGRFYAVLFYLPAGLRTQYTSPPPKGKVYEVIPPVYSPIIKKTPATSHKARVTGFFLLQKTAAPTRRGAK